MELLNKKNFLKKSFAIFCLFIFLIFSSQPYIYAATITAGDQGIMSTVGSDTQSGDDQLANDFQGFGNNANTAGNNNNGGAEGVFFNTTNVNDAQYPDLSDNSLFPGEDGSYDYLYEIAPGEEVQAYGAINGVESQVQSATEVQNTITDTAFQGSTSCIIGGAISNIIKEIFVSAVTNIAAEKVEDAIEGIKEVPVYNPSANDHLRLQTQKESTALKIFGIPVAPGWDAIGYCLINTIIDYITIATIQWINSGFQGNPVFIENPAQFFQDIADIEVEGFLYDLSLGDYICEPFNLANQLALLRNHVNRYGRNNYGYFNNARCSLSDTLPDIGRFVGGDLEYGGWTNFHNLTQNSYNNPYDSHWLAQSQLDQRIGQQQGYQRSQLDWSRGFLSFKDPETGEITTPGSFIEEQINQRAGSSQRRIEMADEFDEIINALVNQLIKIAIDETLTAVYER